MHHIDRSCVIVGMFLKLLRSPTQPPFPICLTHYHSIGQPRGVEYSSDQARCLQLPDLFDDELLPLQSLLSDLMLDRPRMGIDNKVVLNHLPGNAGDVGCLPRKHIDIRPHEGDKLAFLFAVEGGAYGKSSPSAVLFDGHLLGFW